MPSTKGLYRQDQYLMKTKLITPQSQCVSLDDTAGSVSIRQARAGCARRRLHYCLQAVLRIRQTQKTDDALSIITRPLTARSKGLCIVAMFTAAKSRVSSRDQETCVSAPCRAILLLEAQSWCPALQDLLWSNEACNVATLWRTSYSLAESRL